MRCFIVIATFVFLIPSCISNDSKQKEAALKEKVISPEKNNPKINGESLKQDTNLQLLDTQNPEEIVLEIRAETKRINSLPLTNKTFKWEADACANDGIINYFLNHNQIVKVVEDGSIGDGGWTTEYYYKDDKFIFSYEIFIGGPASGPEKTTEFRTYVKDDLIIRTMENKTITNPDKKVLTNSSKEYKILKAFTTKDFETALCE